MAGNSTLECARSSRLSPIDSPWELCLGLGVVELFLCCRHAVMGSEFEYLICLCFQIQAQLHLL